MREYPCIFSAFMHSAFLVFALNSNFKQGRRVQRKRSDSVEQEFEMKRE